MKATNNSKQPIVGIGITGSFCTFAKTKAVLEEMKKDGYDMVPIFSEHTAMMDNRFSAASDFCRDIEAITGHAGIYTIQEAEPIGPNNPFDAMVILPCTGNTLAKLTNGITDTPVLMAAKAHLRNEKPLIISISTNDAMGMNFKNIGQLYNTKHVFFVPFGQDDYQKKKNSLIAHVEQLPQTIKQALEDKQIQPVLQSPFIK